MKKKIKKIAKPKIDKTEKLRQGVIDALKSFIIHYVQIEEFCKARTAGQALEKIMNLKETSGTTTTNTGFVTFQGNHAVANDNVILTSNG